MKQKLEAEKQKAKQDEAVSRLVEFKPDHFTLPQYAEKLAAGPEPHEGQTPFLMIENDNQHVNFSKFFAVRGGRRLHLSVKNLDEAKQAFINYAAAVMW